MDHDAPAICLIHGDDFEWDSVGVRAKEEDQVVAFGGWIEWADAMFHDVPRSFVIMSRTTTMSKNGAPSSPQAVPAVIGRTEK